jgi:hypothetical protein
MEVVLSRDIEALLVHWNGRSIGSLFKNKFLGLDEAIFVDHFLQHKD